MTDEDKDWIDNADYETLLRRWRFALIGDPMFIGDTGVYFSDRMEKLKRSTDHVAISKKIGWDKI